MKLSTLVICSLFVLQLHLVHSNNNQTKAPNESISINDTEIAGKNISVFHIKETKTKSTRSEDLAKELMQEVSKGNNTVMKEKASRKTTNTELKPQTVENTSANTTQMTSTTPAPAKSLQPVEDDKPNKALSKNVGTEMGYKQMESSEGNNNKTNSTTHDKAVPNTNGTSSVVINAANSDDTKSVNDTKTTNVNSTAPSSSTSTTTTTTSTTTTTAKPTKPKIVYSMAVHPEWENANTLPTQKTTKPAVGEAAANTPVLTMSSSYSSLMTQYEPPNVQPLQEQNDNNIHNNNYIVPIFAVIVTVPLAIGVAVTMYRRMREFWSTRHYHRMDFLVDGMYND